MEAGRVEDPIGGEILCLVAGFVAKGCAMETRERCGGKVVTGSVLVIALVFLALFTALAVAIAASSDINLTIARNRIESHQAGALAETGLLLLEKHLGGLEVPGSFAAENLHQALASHLVTAWNASSMLDASDIWGDAEGVHFPPMTIVRGDGRSGAVDVFLSADGGAATKPIITIESTGRFGKAAKGVSYRMTTMDSWSLLSRYGVASRSNIQMSGNAQVVGANEPKEGSILSATYVEMEAITLTGGVYVSGDVAVSNPQASIHKTGKVRIDGSEIYGAEAISWPTPNPALFRPYATNVITSPPAPGTVLSNIYIPANTNLTFNSNVVINGVVYIEQPNRVKFNGSLTLCGLIVTGQADDPAVNTITFAGNTSVLGVENLPPGSQYDGLRNLTGTFLLAPGFGAKFTGGFTTLNGSMVASGFEFSGNAGGTIRGSVVNLADSYFIVKGTAPLRFDHKNANPNPAGLIRPYVLVCVPRSYEE